MRVALGLAMAAVVALSAVYAFSPRTPPPLAPSRLPVERMQFSTVARAGSALVAGGELGHIVFSTDQGKTWQQAQIEPRRYALITQIVFVDDKLGMAVGHEGQILRSDDGGKSWKELAFDQTQGEPLMSIARLPSGRWLTVGAFGRALASDDDGKSWQRVELPGVDDKHMNRIVAGTDPQHWLIVGERGLVLASEDGAQTWRVLPPFYHGSLYGAVQLPKGPWVTYGMRGNAYVAGADLNQWAKAQIPAPISMLGHAVTSDEQLLLVGQGGIVMRSRDHGSSFQIIRAGGRATLMDIQILPDGQLLLPSDGGIQMHEVNQPATANAQSAPAQASPAQTSNAPTNNPATAGAQR